MLSPKRTKFRKQQRGRMQGLATRGCNIDFGDFALQAQEPSWITARQIEAARVAINRTLKRKGKVWIRIFPDKPITSKGSEVPMGGGKGSVEHYVFPASPGRILFEVDGVDEETAKEAFRKAGAKLPMKTKFVAK